jgi:copper chaperone CopZ
MVKQARVSITVPELDCIVCTPVIKRVLKQVKGVKNVEVAIMLNKIFVDYNPEETDTMWIAKALEKTGYKIHMTQVM